MLQSLEKLLGHKIDVTTNQDSILGSLRHAINKANLTPNIVTKIIIKSSVGKVIQLTNGELQIISNIKLINHTGGDLTIKSINGRVFHVLGSNFLKIASHKNKNIIISDGIADTNGGAIFIETSDQQLPSNHQLILKNVIIKNCRANGSGGAIYTNGNVILISSQILSNGANVQGGGIWAGKNVIMYKSLVRKNQILIANESNGGGGLFVDDGNCVLNQSSVSNNSVAYNETIQTGGSGGGVIIMTGSLYLNDNSHIDENSAFNSGGIQEGIGNVYMTGKSSSNKNKSFNSATGAAGGGGITITLGTVFISNSQICDNQTVGMFSGGIVSLVGNVTVTNASLIARNTNNGPGGGIAMNLGSVNISNSSVSHNIGASLGGGIVNFTPNPELISITNSEISHNNLTNAETIRQTLGSFLEVVIGNLSNTEKQAQVSGGSGAQNFIQNIPSIIQRLTTVHEQLKALPIEITFGNTVGGGGIACLLSTEVTIFNSSINNNLCGITVSERNLPFRALGGGVFGWNAKINIQDCMIKKNETVNDGGGIFIGRNGSALIIDTCISENLATERGGGILNHGTLEMISSTIARNKAGKSGGGINTSNPFNELNTIIKQNCPNNVTLDIL